MIMSAGNRFPFTASQWQELEHQALIYKYMVSGIPIPPDLLLTIKRSACLDSSKLFPRQHPHFAWSCFQMGSGRAMDPEPGRCRRTDGKKWRCSKEAYPDSKYCERHMHRGKNRSRKPVEVATQTQTQSTTSPAVSSITRNHSNNSLLTASSHSLSFSLSPETHHLNRFHYPAGYHAHPNHPLFSSSTPTGTGLSPQEYSTHLLLDSGGSSMTSNTDFRRNVYGLKEEVDEHAFFSEPSGSMRSLSGSSLDDAWQLTPLTMNSSSSSSSNNSSKQRNLSSLQTEYSYLQLQSLCDHDTPKQQKQLRHNCLLGNDGSNLGPMKMEKEEPQKTVHRFFDEWPPKNKESWLELDDKSSNSASVSALNIHSFIL
ncbi:hypothetical protein DKX38_028094 [Salix brachista]|uniref:Growth-regulating factor n=1 Tax=Salix brachista TaxID=2182728 RepID=A0A5N5J4P0_9ROSI|nr:hypothetical protein DKX38_028094 [Salix brachista]